MKILLITQFFYPDIQATSQIFHELCEDLAKQHEMTVLCGMPLITAGDNDASQSPESGMKIIRVFSSGRKKKAAFDRLINHLSFSFTSFFRLFKGIKANVVMFTSDNPLSFLNMCFFRRVPKIYLCQDLYLEQGKAVGMYDRGFIRPLLSLCQKLSFRFADKIIVIGERMKKHLQNEGVPPEKIEVISNWADPDMITPCDQDNVFSRECGLVGKFVIMHSGRMGLTQDLELLIKCASGMRGEDDIRFVIAGGGVNREKLVKLAEELSPDNVLFMPYQKKDHLKYSLGAAAIGVILEKKGLAGYLVPSRLYGIMASGKPVIAAVEENSELNDIIRDGCCGIVVPPGDLDEFEKAIRLLYVDRALAKLMGENGRSYLLENFTRSGASAKYLKVISGSTSSGIKLTL